MLVLFLLAVPLISAQPWIVSTFAGSGSAGYTNALGAAARFGNPAGVCIDSTLDVYVADYGNNRIRKIDPTGLVTLVAGSGASALVDGTGAGASFAGPIGIACTPSGKLYVADGDDNNIRIVTPSKVVTTLAGGFVYPTSVAIYGTTVYAPTNNRVLQVDPGGAVSTLAGTGAAGSANGAGNVATFKDPYGLGVNSDTGDIYVADTGNHKIRKVTQAAVVSVFAGKGNAASTDGVGTFASFNAPRGVAVSPAGVVFVADTGNYLIRQILPDRTVTTIAGTGSSTRVDGVGASASFTFPGAIAVSSDGTLIYVADTGSGNSIRQMAINCVANKYAPIGSTSCSNCVVGTMSTGGDLSCWRCSAGYSGATVAQGVMATCTACTAGTYTGAAGMASCTACPAGKTNDGADTSCWKCNIGYFGAIVAQGAMATCTVCAAGKFGATAGLTTNSCTGLCACGTYGAASGLSACTGPCSAGRFGLATSLRTNASCDGPCSFGSYCPLGTCSPTQYLCPAGTFGNTTGLSNATCSGKCSAGFYCPAGSVSAEAFACPAGTFSNATGASFVVNCTTCPAGKFSAAGSTACSACLAGKFSQSAGLAVCEACPRGHFCPAGASSWASNNCGKGHWCPLGTGVPNPCPVQVAPPPFSTWTEHPLRAQGPAFLVETASCENHCYWSASAADGHSSAC